MPTSYVYNSFILLPGVRINDYDADDDEDNSRAIRNYFYLCTQNECKQTKYFIQKQHIRRSVFTEMTYSKCCMAYK